MPAANEAEAPVEAAMTRERKEGRTKRARARGGLAWPRRVELGGGPRRVERRAELRFSAWEEKGERGRCSVRRSGDFSCAWKEKGDEGVFYPFLFVRLPGINFVRGHVVLFVCLESTLRCRLPLLRCGLWPVACGLGGVRAVDDRRHVHVMKFWTACTEWRSTHTMRYCYLQHSGASRIGALLLFK
jgi:hypothetical protein